jgi:hypothetical protein
MPNMPDTTAADQTTNVEQPISQIDLSEESKAKGTRFQTEEERAKMIDTFKQFKLEGE